MARLSPYGKFRAFSNAGLPLSGGKLYTYEANTTTPKPTYTDASEDTANANPVVLDANGYADVWLEGGAYKFILKDSTDSTLWTVDDITSDEARSFGYTTATLSTSTSITSVYDSYFLICTAALTLSLLPAATAGDGFFFIVKNTGSGVVTIDPSDSETVDGASTATISAGSSAVVQCNGTSWQTIFNASPVPYTAASASGAASLQFAEDTDNGTNKVTLAAPAALAADRSITFPDAAGEIVLDAATQTLTNKTLTTPTITLKQSASPTPTAEGAIEWDTDDNRIVVGNSSGQTTFYSGQFPTLIQTQTVSGVASVNFTGLSSTYSVYILEMSNVVPATDATDLYVRTSTNNGSSYDSGASDYAWTRTGNTDASATAGAGGDVADAQMLIAVGMDNAATASLGGTIKLFEFSSSARHKHITAQVAYTRDASTIATFITGGKRLTATACDAFQIITSSGNISGTFSLYGVSK